MNPQQIPRQTDSTLIVRAQILRAKLDNAYEELNRLISELREILAEQEGENGRR